MMYILQSFTKKHVVANAVVLGAITSTHGRPGYQTPDRRVISKSGGGWPLFGRR